MTRFWLKNPNVCLAGVAVSPIEERVEVLEHLAPHPVDRAVALVDDDHVERLDRERRVVVDLDRLGRERRS